MMIKIADGRVGEALAITSCQEVAFVVVKLPDCTMEEWNIKHCLVVEDRKISESGGAVANGEQLAQPAKCPDCGGGGMNYDGDGRELGVCERCDCGLGTQQAGAQ